ncbi:UDP binding domain-containing protein [uncultured Sphaerotilus sp.]|uniref:UDP binding domain-containing protein n=1 Tax=uncultured Sphaerotilus sp. TaxID=474984 RepID=UPI0030CA2097
MKVTVIGTGYDGLVTGACLDVDPAKIQFITVGTPPKEDDSALNISRTMTDLKVIVDKSTVPVGTGDKVHTAVTDELAKRGEDVQAHDPVSAAEAQRVMVGWDSLSYSDRQKQALEGADALLIDTEWKEFCTPDFETIRDGLKDKAVFNGRNLYAPELIRSFGMEYQSIGRM